MDSNGFFVFFIFGTFKMSTKLCTSHPFFIAEILLKLQENYQLMNKNILHISRLGKSRFVWNVVGVFAFNGSGKVQHLQASILQNTAKQQDGWFTQLPKCLSRVSLRTLFLCFLKSFITFPNSEYKWQVNSPRLVTVRSDAEEAVDLTLGVCVVLTIKPHPAVFFFV